MDEDVDEDVDGDAAGDAAGDEDVDEDGDGDGDVDGDEDVTAAARCGRLVGAATHRQDGRYTVEAGYACVLPAEHTGPCADALAALQPGDPGEEE